MANLVIATRGSQLALAQANWVAGQLRGLDPSLDIELRIIKTTGDKILDVPLAKVGGKGLFVKEIEDALLSGEAHLAVHSMKDMPAELPPGLILAAITQREDPRDVLVTPEGKDLSALPLGARVGTSSLRRQAQLLALRPDLEMVSIRGNVGTRLGKINELNLDGIVLAQAGLNRLGQSERGSWPIPTGTMLPAVGQGALGLEARADDERFLPLFRRLADPDTAAAVAAERAFLARLEGGCQVPIAGHATLRDQIVVFHGLVASLDGTRVIKGEGMSAPADAATMGASVALEILDRGGREILSQIYGKAPA